MTNSELEAFGLRIREQSYREGYEAALRDIPRPATMDWNAYYPEAGVVVKAKDALGHGSYKKDERATRANYKGLLHTPSKLLTAATSAASNIIKRLASVPGAALRTAKRVISAQYNKMEARYGKTYARLAVAAVVVGLPIPIPGSSMILMAGVRGLAELHMALDKRLASTTPSPQEDAATRPGLVKRLAGMLRSVVGLENNGAVVAKAFQLLNSKGGIVVKAFDESKHPRANDGKFTDSTGLVGTKVLYNPAEERSWSDRQSFRAVVRDTGVAEGIHVVEPYVYTVKGKEIILHKELDAVWDKTDNSYNIVQRSMPAERIEDRVYTHGTSHEIASVTDIRPGKGYGNWGQNEYEAIYLAQKNHDITGDGWGSNIHEATLLPGTKIAKTHYEIREAAQKHPGLSKQEALIAEGYHGVAHIDERGDVWELALFSNRLTPYTPPSIETKGIDPDTGTVVVKAKDAHGHEHAPAGQPTGGQFVSTGGAGGTPTEKGKKPKKKTDVVHPDIEKAVGKWLDPFFTEHLTSGEREKYKNGITHVLSKMSDSARSQALKNIEHVNFKESIEKVTSTFFGTEDKSKHIVPGTNFTARIAGYVDHFKEGTCIMVLDGGHDGTEDTMRGTYTHELAHTLDVLGKYSDDPHWQFAWSEEIFNGKTPPSEYATTNPAEGFAELYRAVIEKGVAKTKKRYPLCMKFLEEKGLL